MLKKYLRESFTIAIFILKIKMHQNASLGDYQNASLGDFSLFVRVKLIQVLEIKSKTVGLKGFRKKIKQVKSNKLNLVKIAFDQIAKNYKPTLKVCLIRIKQTTRKAKVEMLDILAKVKVNTQAIIISKDFIMVKDIIMIIV